MSIEIGGKMMKMNIDPFQTQIGYMEPKFNTNDGVVMNEGLNVMMVDIIEDVNPRHVRASKKSRICSSLSWANLKLKDKDIRLCPRYNVLFDQSFENKNWVEKKKIVTTKAQ